MTIRHLSVRVFYVAFCLCASCGAAEQPGNSADALLGGSQTGDFRGVQLGDDRDAVRKKESNAAVYSMPDELVYKLPLQQGADYSYEISYMFDDDGLYDIEMLIMARNDSIMDVLRNEVSELYQTRYGSPKREEMNQTWKALSGSGRYVRLVLQDSLNHNGLPALKVRFHESE